MYRNNKRSKIKGLFLGILICILSVACGGGGGGDDVESPPSGQPVTPDPQPVTPDPPANMVPSFGSAMIDDKNYILNTAILTETLPAATGGDGTLTYSLTPNSPAAGLTFNSSTRQLRGIPTALGTTMVTYTATDQDGDEATLTFSIEVVAEDRMPSFGSAMIDDKNYIQNTAIRTETLPAATGGNGTLTYSLTPNSPATALPSGLTFNSGTRQLTGTPTTAGTTMVTYTATDQDGDEATLTFSIEVAQDLMPTFGGSIANKQYVLNRAIQTETLPAATGGDLPLNYTLVPLPDGLVFDNTTRELRGTPTALGTTTMVTYTVTDADGDTDMLTFSIEVVVDPRPSFGGQTVESPRIYVNGVDRGPFTLPEATGRDVPLAYSLSPLPNGMTFNADTRILDGTPTVIRNTDLTYTVTDADGQTDELTFTVTNREPEDKDICGRTQKVEDAIIEELHETDDTIVCGAVSETELGGIDALDLAGEAITSLQAGDFDDLAGLTNLQLGENTLTSLPEGVFDDLLHLERLNLENNGLMTIPEGLFKGHSVLTSLTLDLNNFSQETLPEDLFAGLFNLATLRVEGSRLTTLSEDVFDGLTSLETLSLHNNRLLTLPADVFDGLSSLTSLDLSSNRLGTGNQNPMGVPLSEDLFNGLTSLETLRLNSNNLETLPENLFDGLDSLTRLDLRGNTRNLPTPAICMEAMVNCQTN